MLATLNEAPLAYLIVLVTVIISSYALFHVPFAERWRMHPHSVYRGHRIYTVFTSIFLHVSVPHLLVNALVLLIGLPEIEYMLVQDFGPVSGRFLLLVAVLWPAAFSGLLSAVRHRHRELRWTAGMSAVNWSQVFVYLLYFPLDPIPGTTNFASGVWPIWIALVLLVLLLALAQWGDPAGSIHLYGALAGIVFVTLVKPVAITRVSGFIDGVYPSEKSNDPPPRHDHRPAQSNDYASEDGTFAPFSTLDKAGRVEVKAMHPLGNRQCDGLRFVFRHDTWFLIPPHHGEVLQISTHKYYILLKVNVINMTSGYKIYL